MSSEAYRKILIRFPNWLGDCVMAMPVLEVLQNKLPAAEIAVMARGGLSELFRHDPRVRILLEFDDKSGGNKLADFKRIARSLREEDFDLCLILPDSFSSALLPFMAGIPIRIGYGAEMRGIMLTRSLTQPPEIIHRSRKYINILSELGISVSEIPHPQIFSDDSAKRNARELVGTLSPYIVIAPQTRAPSRRWGADKYSELIRRIVQELKINVVLAGAADEYDPALKVGMQSGVKFLNIAGKSTLLSSHEIMKNALAYVGNDSGGAHLAASSGTYTVSISGADNPQETHPLIKRGKVIRKDLPCSPCVKNICPRKDFPMECMDIISVQEVFEVISEGIDV